MVTLHEHSLFNNPNLKIINNNDQLSGDAGLVLIQELWQKLRIDSLIQQYLSTNDARKRPQHSRFKLLKQVILQMLAGYRYDSAATRLQNDPIFKLLLNSSHIASQPTLSRFYRSFETNEIADLERLIRHLTDQFLCRQNQQELIIDVDSTHADTFGHQEQANYNAHYQTDGYHPMIAFDSLSGLLLGASLRPGSAYTSTGVAEFLAPIISHYQQFSCDQNILIRGDSGFATPELYSLCDQTATKFVIKLKANRRLKDLAEHAITYDDSFCSAESDTQYFELNYRPSTWQKAYRVVVQAHRPASELLFTYEFLATNLTELRPVDLFATYDQRGAAENLIKEAKLGFFFDKTDCHQFLGNQVHMLLSAIAYNIGQLFKALALPAKAQHQTIATIRFQLLRIPAKIVHHARKIWIQLSTNNVFDRLFWQVLHRIQQL